MRAGQHGSPSPALAAAAMWPAVIANWQSTPQERARPFPCDELIAAPDAALFRAVDVQAEPATLFRWLCQLRVAPYSYDLLDNLGRRSPQTLTPGLEELAVGQRMMTVFRLVAFERDRSITILSQGRLFGRVACTYALATASTGGSRLVVKLLVDYSPLGLLRAPMRLLLPPGDLVMMRRQLLNLKRLAESTG